MGTPPQGLKSLLKKNQRIMVWMPTKHMGNLLVSLLAIKKLEDILNEQHCSLIVDESYKDIIEAAQLKSTLIYYPRNKIDTLPFYPRCVESLRFIKQLRRSNPDIAIVIEGDKISQRFIPLSGCRLKIGPANRYCKKFDLQIPLDHGQSHRFFDYAAVTQSISNRTFKPGYPSLASSFNSLNIVHQLLTKQGLNAETPYAILHPGATKDYKQWPLTFFAEIANYLTENNVTVVVSGAGQRDEDTINKLAQLVDTPFISLHNKLSIDQLIAACQGATFFLGNDTGPTHLSAATGTATYALFGPTDENRWGPIGQNVTILRSNIPCEPECSRRSCNMGYRCMKMLLPQQVKKTIAPLKELTTKKGCKGMQHPRQRDLKAKKTPTILHVFKRYNGNYPLLNSMVATKPGKYRTLVCYMSGDDDGENTITEQGVETIYLNLEKKNINWHSLSTLFAIKEIIDRYNVDLAICQFRRTIPIGSIAARLSDSKPVVAAILHGIVRGKNTTFEKIINFLINHWVNAWISVSQEGMKDIYAQNIAIPQKKIFSVQNGLDYAAFTSQKNSQNLHSLFKNSSGKERIYLSVGRLSIKKNQERIICAFKKLVEEDPKSLLIIVGHGPLEDFLKTRAKNLGLQNHIVFTGFRKDIPSLLSSADVFLIPSIREGLPLALLEAMASSLPVINSDINGMREVITGVDCGWLVDPHNTDSIAQALISASKTSDDELKIMGEKGKTHVIKNFSRQQMIHNYETLFDRLIQQRNNN